MRGVLSENKDADRGVFLASIYNIAYLLYFAITNQQQKVVLFVHD